MFLVMDLSFIDKVASEGSRPDTRSHSLAYTKMRSMTGVSSASTEDSSDSSMPGYPPDALDGGDGMEETFYDCRSQAGSHASLASRDHEIAMYINDKCIYADGTPAFVPPGHCISNVSNDFREFHDFDEIKALKMWNDMLKWRQENQIWSIHTRPNVHFHIAKKYYPSCYHGVDMEDAVVEFSFPGRMVPDKLFPTVTAMDHIMEHHIFMQEYLHNCLYIDQESWQKIGKEPVMLQPENGCKGIVLVIDVKGAGINLLSGNVFTFMKRMIQNSTAYYPAMAKRVIVINSPFWVAGVFKTIQPLLPDALPVDIVSEKNTLTALRAHIHNDQIPVEYGGSSPYPLHKHPFELRLQEKAEKAANYGMAKTSTTTIVVSPEVLFHKASGDTMDTSRSSRSTFSRDDALVQQTTTSQCCRLPFRTVFRRTQEPLLMVSDNGKLLNLALGPPTCDGICVACNIWSSIAKGFKGCGGCKTGH